MTFEFEYLGEFEFIYLKKIQREESGDQEGDTDEKKVENLEQAYLSDFSVVFSAFQWFHLCFVV